MRAGLVTLAVGAPVWFVYWVRTAARDERTPLWLAYVLLVGVAGGLVTAIVAASTLLYQVLVWLVGDPGPRPPRSTSTTRPLRQRRRSSGSCVWWYHRTVLRAGAGEARTEVRRVYEYLMAGTGLLAASAGLVIVLAALVEAATGSAFVGGERRQHTARGSHAAGRRWPGVVAVLAADPDGEPGRARRRAHVPDQAGLPRHPVRARVASRPSSR